MCNICVRYIVLYESHHSLAVIQTIEHMMWDEVNLDNFGHHYINLYLLIHWDWVMHICVGNQTIIGSDNGLSPDRRQAIIWTNAGILLIRPLGTNFSEILIEIYTLSFKKIHLKMSSRKWRPLCLGLNVLSMYCLILTLSSVIWIEQFNMDIW